MKKAISLLLLLAVIFMPAKAQDVENVKPVKNVILLIPDGTSLATVPWRVGCNGIPTPTNRN